MLLTSKYIAFLDADDWWHPKKLEISIEELEKGHDFVYHDLIMYDESIDEIDKKVLMKTRVLKKPVYEDLLFHGNGITNSSVVVKRELMLKIDGFSENKLLIATEDYEAWLRLSKLNIEFLRLDNALGYYCTGNDNLSSSKKTSIFIHELIKIYCSDQSFPLSTLPNWMRLSLGKAYLYQKNYTTSIYYLSQAFICNPIQSFKTILHKF